MTPQPFTSVIRGFFWLCAGWTLCACASESGQAPDTSLPIDAGQRDAEHEPLAVDADQSTEPLPLLSSREIVELVRSGEHQKALQALERLPEDRSSPGLTYLRARMLEETGDSARAAEALDGVGAEVPESVRADIELRQVVLLEQAGQCAKARAAIDRHPHWSHNRQVQGIQARCAWQLGALDQVVSILTPLAKKQRGLSFEEKLLLAKALAKTGKGTDAAALARDLVVSSPEHPEQDAALELLAYLEGEVTFSFQERISRTETLLKRRQFDRAVQEISAVDRPSRPGQLAKWLHLKGMSVYKTRGDYALAAKILKQSARLRGSTAIADEFHAARALSRADQDEEAVRAYRRFVVAHPNDELSTDAEYLAAWLEIRLGKKSGSRNMQAFVDGPRGRKKDRFYREALWHLGFEAFQKGRYMSAAASFGRYAKTGSGGLIRGRGTYWYARAVEALGRNEAAQATYKRALHIDPLHWYAILAAGRLKKLGVVDVGDPFPPSAKAAPLPPLEVVLPDDVLFYAALGLEEQALDALRGQERALRQGAPRGRELEAVLMGYQLLGGARRAYLLSRSRRSELRRRPTERNQWLWRASYPTPHPQLVAATAKRYGIEPAHVYATMRQESGYAPRAVSRADAIGLLQLLPATAGRFAQEYGVPFHRQMLFDVRWNIRFGISELASVRSDMDGHLPLAIAAYNAGSSRVKRWLRETGEVPLDVFVERIPFDETRNYVRRVMSHYARYRFLEDAESWPLELPEKVPPPQNH